MSFIEEYKTYLQDNPQGYWFKRKLYGFGWIPATKQGWGLLGTYLFFVIGLAVWAEQNLVDAQLVSHFLVPVLAATLLLLLTAYRTGEPLRWQWGKSDGK